MKEETTLEFNQFVLCLLCFFVANSLLRNLRNLRIQNSFRRVSR